MSATRKLLTVFYADVAACSRLTDDDEEGTHQRVMAILDHVFSVQDRCLNDTLNLLALQEFPNP